MKKLLPLWFALTLAVLVYGFYLAIFVAPADAEQGNVFRIFFYHVPSAIMALIFPYANFIAALFYLGMRRKNPLGALKADAFALAAAEVTLAGTPCQRTSNMPVRRCPVSIQFQTFGSTGAKT